MKVKWIDISMNSRWLDERTLRKLIRDSVREGMSLTRDEERVIENAFLRLVRERVDLSEVVPRAA